MGSIPFLSLIVPIFAWNVPSVQSFSHQHARVPCPSPALRACSNSCPLSRWCHPTTSSLSSPFPPAFNFPLVSLIFLKRSQVFPSLLFSFVSLHCSLRKPLSPLLSVLWNSAFRWFYLSFFPLSLAYLLSSAIFKASLYGSLNILWHCFSLRLAWILTLSIPMATAEFSKLSGYIECSTLIASSFRILNR